MKKIGKEVLFLQTGEGNPRNGEGTFARLSDGRIMCAFTQYYGTDWSDHAIARICACYSSDEGESWSEPRIVLEKDEKAENIMSPSLFRMKNGKLGIIYLRKEKMADNGITCMPYFRCLSEENYTFSEPIACNLPLGYYCTVNDCVTVLKSGRIIVSASYHGLRYDAYHNCTLDLGEKKGAEIVFACSDDNGETWSELGERIVSPYGDTVGLAEPGIYEYEDTRLWMYCRTAYGHQYQSFSCDGGKTWSTPAPNFCFTSPDSPMRVKRVGRFTVAVFNPLGYSCVKASLEAWGSPRRTPLVCAVSENDGLSFDTTGKTPANREMRHFAKSTYYIEDGENDSYCYPAIIETKDGFLVSYYHSAGMPYCLNCMKMVKVRFDELEQGEL